MDKRTVRRIVATALAVILAEQVFFLICGFGLPVQFGDTFMGELKSKYERLKETSGKRIVLVGGSGVAFDCDSALMDDFFPSYEIVNFGMYAGLGTKAVMDLSESFPRSRVSRHFPIILTENTCGRLLMEPLECFVI